MGIMDISKALDIARKDVNHAVQTMHKKGELERVVRGQYRLAEKSKRARMWKIVRARGNVTAEVLAELTDSTLQYAQKYLRALVAQDIMARSRRGDNTWVYRLKHDTGPIAPAQSIKEVDRLLAWQEIQEAKREAEQKMNHFMKLMEAYDEQYGEKPDGHAAA